MVDKDKKLYLVTYDTIEYDSRYVGIVGVFTTLGLAEAAIPNCGWPDDCQITRISIDVPMQEQDYGELL